MKCAPQRWLVTKAQISLIICVCETAIWCIFLSGLDLWPLSTATSPPKTLKPTTLMSSCTVRLLTWLDLVFTCLSGLELGKYMSLKIGPSEHQNASCHFAFLWLGGRRMFRLTCCRWRFSVRAQVRCLYVSCIRSSLQGLNPPCCPSWPVHWSRIASQRFLCQMFRHISVGFHFRVLSAACLLTYLCGYVRVQWQCDIGLK